jgi:hypothetical protein
MGKKSSYFRLYKLFVMSWNKNDQSHSKDSADWREIVVADIPKLANSCRFDIC